MQQKFSAPIEQMDGEGRRIWMGKTDTAMWQTVPFANQPVRAEGLGRNAGSCAVFSQAVRPAGKKRKKTIMSDFHVNQRDVINVYSY